MGDDGPARPRGAAGRVKLAQRQARLTIPLVLLFVVAAVAAAAAAAVTGGTRWAWLHLLFAGGIVLLISAVSLMLTVTWSAAPAPSDRLVVVQRSLVTVGAATVVGGRELAAPHPVVTSGAVVYVAGLALLGYLLVATVRRGVERRFDVAVAGYVVALVAGATAAVLGAVMAATSPTLNLRATHMTLNLLGLVGMVIGATLPFYVATVVRSKMAPLARPRYLVAWLCVQTVALAVAAAGFAASLDVVAAAGLGLYAAGLCGLAPALPKPTRRQLEWAGPRLIGMWAGIAWWVVATAVAAVDAARGAAPLSGRWLLVLALAAYGQIVWGSLAYLLPVLRGGGHVLLSAGFATTRSWVGLAAVNVAGVALVAGLPPVAAVAVAVWVADTLWRFARLSVGEPPPTKSEAED